MYLPQTRDNELSASHNKTVYFLRHLILSFPINTTHTTPVGAWIPLVACCTGAPLYEKKLEGLNDSPPLPFFSSGVGTVGRIRCSERSFRSSHAKLANSFIHLFCFLFSLKIRQQVCGRGLIEKVNSSLTSIYRNCPMR